jgi:hypothetical protein
MTILTREDNRAPMQHRSLQLITAILANELPSGIKTRPL